MRLIDWIMTLMAFLGIWIGAILAVKPIDKIAKKFNSSSFIVSFFLLGILTSLTEVSVAFNSFIDNNVEISVGNLLGGTLVLLLFVIPLLGVLVNGIKLNHGFGVTNVFLSIAYLLVPHIFLIDKKLSIGESIVLAALYMFLAILLYIRNRIKLSTKVKQASQKVSYLKVLTAFISLTFGSVILIFSSNVLVDNVDKIGAIFKLSPFVLALLGLSLGTNLPEISLAIISALKGKSEIGFGNYLGSALFNPFILAVLGIFTGGITINANFIILLIFSTVGFLLFFVYIRSKNFLSRQESLLLLLIYIIFILTELIRQFRYY
ncbi:MAG: hypothetical protein Fur003_2870 [Candidatus Dojkabacteria bacterium]